MTFNVQVDLMDTPERLGKSFDKAQFVLDKLILKDSNYYIPADTWNLRDSSLIHSRVGEGELAWQTPYARKLYYNPDYSFSGDKNPRASGLWFEEAKSKKLKDWIDQADKTVKGDF